MPFTVPASKDGVGCVHINVLPVAPGYEWDGNWQLDLNNVNGAAGVGETDEEGWDYATNANRFGPGKGAYRIPRPQGLKDLVRPCRWVRNMRPIATVAQNGLNSTPEANQEMVRMLDGMACAQCEVEKMGLRLGTGDDSSKVRSTIQDYLMDKQLLEEVGSVSDVGSQVTLAVNKGKEDNDGCNVELSSQPSLRVQDQSSGQLAVPNKTFTLSLLISFLFGISTPS